MGTTGVTLPGKDQPIVFPSNFPGAPGRGISNVSLDASGHLQVELTDETTVDAGDIITLLAGNYVPLLLLASSPDQIASGAITRSATGAATGFAVAWPDGATGTFIGTESTSFPGAIDSYTVTHVKSAVTTTYTQPALTRDASGNVTNRPAITVS